MSWGFWFDSFLLLVIAGLIWALRSAWIEIGRKERENERALDVAKSQKEYADIASERRDRDDVTDRMHDGTF